MRRQTKEGAMSLTIAKLTPIIEDAIMALQKLNNDRDRILALYEAMRRNEEAMDAMRARKRAGHL